MLGPVADFTISEECMARILMTGAAGYIGSRLAQQLLERGDEVIAVDNFMHTKPHFFTLLDTKN